MTEAKPEHIRPKERAIRYYGYQNIAQQLYEESKNHKQFRSLINYITQDNNIAQAYRSIKKNKGALTKGTDRKTMKEIGSTELQRLKKRLKIEIADYHPKAIRRVLIPKKTPGQFRPLGIPTATDKVIQQMIKQIIEPIFEAKFCTSSYGFRPARNQHQAIEHVQRLIARSGYTHAIEFDIKKYFDSIPHNILIEILCREGIKDPRLLTIIKRMLKAPIKGEGIPKAGTPQGGILSPLLANIYLNELDKFIYSMFQNLKTTDKNRWKRKRLKPIHIVRYADDFCIFTKSYKHAKYYLKIIIQFLKTQLELEYSPEKTRITNLKRRAIHFLGIKIKATQSKDKKIKHLVAKSYIEKVKVIELVRKIKNEPDQSKAISIIKGNFNYWSIATAITKVAGFYNWHIYRVNKNKPRKKRTAQNTSNNQLIVLDSQKITKANYKKVTLPSQDSFVKNLENLSDLNISQWFKSEYDTIEKYDIIRSKGRTQKFRDYITREPLINPHCHRINPQFKGGQYNYKNCVLVNQETHIAIHGTMKRLIDFCRGLKKKAILKIAKLYKVAH